MGEAAFQKPAGQGQEAAPSVTNGTHAAHLGNDDVLEFDVLVIGAGPTGASMGLFLSRLGISSLSISRHIGTANTPRAHLFNQRAMETMRDAGIEEDLMAAATRSKYLQHISWSHSLAGEEYARLYYQGAGPERKGDFEISSPCEIVDLPQIRFEPILVRKAEEAGAEFWWYWEFVSQVEIDGKVETLLRDRKSGVERKIRSKYLIGADGARSAVLESTGIQVDGKRLNSVFNVHIRADLSRWLEVRPGVLNWVLNPEAPEWSAVGNFRLVNPWDEFAVSMHPAETKGEHAFAPTHDDIRTRLYQLIGVEPDAGPAIEILSVSRWHVNDQIARSYQKGRVICIGDAVHRHPPINGLGSNTSISDAMNVAWKLAYVLKGLSSPSILDSITLERQPVGKGVVRRANEGMLEHRYLWSVIGLEKEERREKLKVMVSATAAGKALREQWAEAVQATNRELNALGIQMNQRYYGSPLTVIEANDTGKPDLSGIDLEMSLIRTTYPGWHMPHVWIAKNGQTPRQSILDVCGQGRFTLLTGVGGERWRQYAKEVAIRRPGLDVVVVSIGWRQDYMDAYWDWSKVRGVDDDGAVLVRPDQFVCWRCNSIADVGPNRLMEVFDQLLPPI